MKPCPTANPLGAHLEDSGLKMLEALWAKSIVTNPGFDLRNLLKASKALAVLAKHETMEDWIFIQYVFLGTDTVDLFTRRSTWKHREPN